MFNKLNINISNYTINFHFSKAIFIAATILTVSACGSSSSDDESINDVDSIPTNTITPFASSLIGEWRFCSAIASTGDSSELHTLIFTENRFNNYKESHENSDCSGNVSLGPSNRILEKEGTYELVGEFITESGLTAQKIDYSVEHPTDSSLNTIEYAIIHISDADQLFIESEISSLSDDRSQSLELETPFLKQTSLTSNQNELAQGECGDITIARMDWASAELNAEIDKLILTEGYGCNAEFVAGSTLPTFTSMKERGVPDLAPELWVNNIRESLDAAVAEGGMIIAAETYSDGGLEGWWIPKYLADANPDIKTAADALARPDLFPSPEDPSKGAVHNCPIVWDCEIIVSNLFKAYEGEANGFELIDPGSASGLDSSIARAHSRQEGWLGYYWSPTPIMGRYEMVKLDMGEHDKEHWDTCTSVRDCAEPKVNNWAKNEIFNVVTNEFPNKAGIAMNYISARTWETTTINTVLAWMDDNQATGEQAAVHFIENYEEIWGAWVSQEVLEKVKASL